MSGVMGEEYLECVVRYSNHGSYQLAFRLERRFADLFNTDNIDGVVVPAYFDVLIEHRLWLEALTVP